MKLQHLSVIFVIIILPIILVMSVYTNNLINVSNTESSYNKILMNSTYDAVRAYQLNTLNNTYASVSESRMRDVRASTNTFFNSLASGLSQSGLTKEELNAYVPAILFTLYDGYYIYTPYSNVASTSSKGVNFSNSGSVSGNMQFDFKPFTYYSCEYKSKTGDPKSFDIVVNYTLDNYITIMGTFDGEYFTDSGYYINPESVTNIDDNSKIVTITKNSKSITLKPEILGEYISASDQVTNNGKNTYTTPTIKYYRYINYNEEKYYYDDSPNKEATSYQGVPIFYLQNNVKIYISSNFEGELQNYGIDTSNRDNYKDLNYYHYYKKAKKFSQEEYEKLKYIKTDNAVTDYYTKDYKVYVEKHKEKEYDRESAHIKTELTGDDAYIFDYKKNKYANDPELETSSFNSHRIDVIASTIESNLSTSIANFNNYYTSQFEYAMPTLSENDWYNIANNVTVVSFMQGMTLGNYKFYNGYSVVANTKNKEFVSKNSIYVENYENPPTYENGNSQYHSPGCLTYNEYVNDSKNQNVSVVGYRNIDYELQNYNNNGTTINYYLQPQTAAYECVVSRNQTEFSSDDYFGFKDKTIETTGENGKTKKVVINEKIRTAYIQALAREKGAGSVLKLGKIEKTAVSNAKPTETHTTNSITITNKQSSTDGSGVKLIEYSNDNGLTWQKSNTFTGLKQNEEYTIKTRVTDNNGKTTESESKTVITNKIVQAGQAYASPSSWTNKDVTVTLPTKSNFTTVYTTNGTIPTINNTGYSGPFTVSKNCIIVYAYIDGNNIGGAGTLNVGNIDKIPPTDTRPTETHTANSITITNKQTDSGGSKIKTIEYSIDNGNTWQKTNEFKGLATNKAYTLRTRATDNAGNVTVSQKTMVMLGAITAQADPTSLTSGDVTITIMAADGYKRVYTTDGSVPTTKSTEYNNPFKVDKNCTIIYAFVDGNEIGGVGTLKISNIDKTTYSIAYNLNGGSGTNPTTYKVDTATFALRNPTKSGYMFAGWTGSNGNIPQTEISIPKGSQGNRTYTANWVSSGYKIEYNLLGGTAVNPSVYNVETATFTLRNPTRGGYSFTGWTGSNGNSPQTAVTIAKGSKGDRTYTANWNTINYTISYNLNGGTATNPTNYNSATETFELAIPTREGYTFTGWTGSNGSSPQTNVKIIKGSTGNRTYTANWTQTPYTIEYDLDGGIATNPTSYEAGTETFTLNNPTKEGYTFIGWTGSNGSTPQTSVTISKGSNGDRVYVANWQINQYYVDLNAILDGNLLYSELPLYADVYADGALIVKDADDFYQQVEYGTKIEIKNIRAENGYSLRSATSWSTIVRGYVSYSPIIKTIPPVGKATVNPSTLTNKDVTVTLPTTTDFKTTYTTDGTAPTPNSTTYTAPFTITQNCTITFLYTDGLNTNTPGTLSITNIDKTAPTTDAPTAKAKVESITITNKQTDKESGIKSVEYSIDGGKTWKSSNTFDGLSPSTKYTIATKATDNAGNTSTSSTSSITTLKAIAKVDNKKYESVQSAINSVPADNSAKIVYLLIDTEENFTVQQNKTITLDLSNHTIKTTSYITNNGTLAIKNGTITDKDSIAIYNKGNLTVMSGTIYAYDGYVIWNDGGNITMTGGKVSSNIGYVVHSESGNITITGGTIATDLGAGISAENGQIYIGGSAIINGGISTSYSVTAYITGGTIYGQTDNNGTLSITGGTVNGIFNKNRGATSITGGTIYSDTNAIYNRDGTTSIAGGTIYSSGANYPTIYNYSTLIISGGSIYNNGGGYGVYNNGGSVSITGGYISSRNF